MTNTTNNQIDRDRNFQSIDLCRGREVMVLYPEAKYETNGVVTSVLTFAERHEARIETKLPNGDIGIVRIIVRRTRER